MHEAVEFAVLDAKAVSGLDEVHEVYASSSVTFFNFHCLLQDGVRHRLIYCVEGVDRCTLPGLGVQDVGIDRMPCSFAEEPHELQLGAPVPFTEWMDVIDVSDDLGRISGEIFGFQST